MNSNEVHMIDAVRLSIELLREMQNRRRLVVLFSDGIDASQSKEIFNDIGKRAREAGVVIDTIGFSPFEPGRMRTLGDISRNATGTTRGCRNVEEIDDRFAQVADEINSTVVLTFGLTTSGDGQPHNYQIGYKSGATDLTSEQLPLALPAFTPADEASRPFWHYLLMGGGVLLLIVIILGIVGSRMSQAPPPMMMPPGQQGQWQQQGGGGAGGFKPGVYQPGQPPQRR